MGKKNSIHKYNSNHEVNNAYDDEFEKFLCMKENYCPRCNKLKPEVKSNYIKACPPMCKSTRFNDNSSRKVSNKVASPTYVPCASYFDSRDRNSSLTQTNQIFSQSTGVSSTVNASTCCCVDEKEWSESDDNLECCCDANKNCRCYEPLEKLRNNQPNRIKRSLDVPRGEGFIRDEFVRENYRREDFERNDLDREESERNFRREDFERDFRRESADREYYRRKSSNSNREEFIEDDFRRDDFKKEEEVKSKRGWFRRRESKREEFPNSDSCTCRDSKFNQDIIMPPNKEINENIIPKRSLSSFNSTYQNNPISFPETRSFNVPISRSSCRPGLCPPIRCPFCHMTKKETQDKCNNTNKKKKCCCFRKKKC